MQIYLALNKLLWNCNVQLRLIPSQSGINWNYLRLCHLHQKYFLWRLQYKSYILQIMRKFTLLIISPRWLNQFEAIVQTVMKYCNFSRYFKKYIYLFLKLASFKNFIWLQKTTTTPIRATLFPLFFQSMINFVLEYLRQVILYFW